MREMYTKAWFPYCNAMGISWDDFWEMNPRIVDAHKEGYKLKRQEENAFAYIQGIYVRDALASTVGNMFKKKSAKPNEYPSKPYPMFGEEDTEQIESKENDGGLSEAEKKRKTEQLFGMLRLMQANFELSKGANTGESE